jgi:hypothetical protein
MIEFNDRNLDIDRFEDTKCEFGIAGLVIDTEINGAIALQQRKLDLLGNTICSGGIMVKMIGGKFLQLPT